MSIKPLRQTQQVNVDFICPWTQESGRCLTLATASGVTFAQYAYDPTDAAPLGMQLHDIEWMNTTLHYNRTYRGITTDVPYGTVGIGVRGEFSTDWVYPVGTISPGDTVYVGPSGMFTNSDSFGGMQIGRFIGALQTDPHTVTFRGMGFSRQYMDTVTKQIVWENNPADATELATPGYIKIAVDMGARL